MRNSRSTLTNHAYFYSFLIVGIVGLLSPFSYNLLPSNAIFEIVLVVCAALVFRIPKRSVFLFAAASGLYLLLSFALMRLFQPAHPLDFAQAYKAFFYVIPLCVFYKRNVFDRASAAKLLKLLIILFLLKYGYSVALNLTPRMGDRPGLFLENNFELIFLMIVFYVLRDDLGRQMISWFLALVAIIALSGSRSSMLALIVLFYGLFLTRLTLKSFFYMAGLALLGGATAGIFVLRSDGGGIQSIDRYNFAMVFLSEVSNWPAWKFAVGSMPLTPLSPQSCAHLSYYVDLFSFSGNGSCYSVILHSYILRVIFDHGALGLIFLISFIALSLTRSGYSRMESFIVLMIICSSSLSVSAMNSVFVSLALALALGIRKHGQADTPANLRRPDFS